MLPGERKRTCSQCGQLMATHRLGVRLGPLRARIFDAIKRAGPGGIEGDDLFDLILAERGVQRSALKAHVWAINDLISDSGWRIASARGTGARFWLARVNANASEHKKTG